ncbi:putative ADP ribosylglycohydrolase [Trypanosoma vivax]|uniref:ADP-ribosylglycohydrolase n=1 Tax=Trypanosoma vivax (strain Y486) TaxID=1055687 RepID=G0UD94_TRYVY|nr:hypothetical protein TRVL_00544 [Trypanosoma vivax]KAH8608914.1 putative ADP ribosylglycohydrolase [Trypanosoma vivax]CCC53805.1 conserved hypothetical protein [Trypanosoma vivax Y486]
MVATLHHNAVPRTGNFYESSFRQLSDIQQKQVGLLVGAAIADAAARALDGRTREEIAMLVANEQGRKQDGDEDPLAFAHAGACLHGPGLLQWHSYTFLLASQLLRVMASARGELRVSYVKEKWVSTATAYPESFAGEHASLLHVLGVMLPLSVSYPWTDDYTLRSYATPFIDFLTETPGGQRAPTRAATHVHVGSVLGVALRCLQSNPDPYRNAALMAVPGSADVFPSDLSHLCPPSSTGENIDLCARGETASFPARPPLSDVIVVREALSIARNARTFADGVKEAIRLGGPTCQRSIITGALLGACMGVRRIPISWLSATRDHVPLVTQALQVAQWSWNPPNR